MERYTLKTARDRVKLTLTEAAKELGITAETLSSYEKGKTFPDVPMIMRIEVLYGVKYNEIIFLVDNHG